MHPLHRLPTPLRALFALWLLLGLLVGPVQAARHAGAMAAGQLVCSVAGAYVVGADGELLPADGIGAHDCCQAAASALPRPVAVVEPLPFAAVEPAAVPLARPVAAPAPLPPARGPPALRNPLTLRR